MNPDIIYAGLDPGFNAIKIARVQDGKISTYVLPASVGEPSRGRKDGLTLAGVVRPQRAIRRPFRVIFDQTEYLVGPNISDFAEPVDRLDFDRFTDSPELRATFYAAVHQLTADGGSHRLALAVALPVEVVQDKTEALRVERAMRSWMVGQHVFSVDDVETVVTITAIRAKIPQPVATWFDWGMDTLGQWIKGREAQRAPTLIVDQGFNTLDVLVVEGGQISQRISEGDPLGMRRAAERLIRSLKYSYGLELELRRANDLVQAAVNEWQTETYVNGQLTDISQEARRAVQSLAADVHNFLDRTVGKSGNAYTVLLTGGGALALSSTLLRQFPTATVMYEPVLANARGLAKLAVRPGFLND
jgi:hypothetical protein